MCTLFTYNLNKCLTDQLSVAAISYSELEVKIYNFFCDLDKKNNVVFEIVNKIISMIKLTRSSERMNPMLTLARKSWQYYLIHTDKSFRTLVKPK